MTMDAKPAERITLGPMAARAKNDLLVCLSHLRWNFVYQRPQHLMTRAADHCDVLFWEEPVFEEADAHLRIETLPGGLEVGTPVLPLGTSPGQARDMQRSMLDDAIAHRRRGNLLLWYYTPMALEFSSHLQADTCVYDCMDELSAFRGAPPEMLSREAELLSRADLVFTGGRSLYEAKRGRHDDIHAFPSSIDKAHFEQARAYGGDEPDDQALIARPRIGFCGVIDERMDLGLLAGLADLEPGWQFVMIGPVVKIDPHELPRRPNIHWLGMKTYAALPAYIAGWDLAFMPFALNEATRFISPTKTPEFLAAGLPVVSTAIRDVVQPYGEAGLVGIADDPASMRERISQALTGERRGRLAEVDRFLAGMSWDRTFSDMHALMRTVRRPPAAGLPARPERVPHV